MVAGDVAAVAEPHPALRPRRRHLGGLAVGDRIGAQVLPGLDLAPEPSPQLRPHRRLEARIGPAGDGRGDQGPARRGVAGRHVGQHRDVGGRAGPAPVQAERPGADRWPGRARTTRTTPPSNPPPPGRAAGRRRDLRWRRRRPAPGRWRRRRCAPWCRTRPAPRGRGGRCHLGRRAASCAGSSPMPRAGTAASPSASIRNTTSNMRLDVCRSGSSWIPPNSGRKKRSMARDDRWRRRSASMVVVSGRRSRAAAGPRRTSWRSTAMRALSRGEPISAPSVATRWRGWRKGSATRWKALACQTRAPGSKRQRSSAVEVELGLRLRVCGEQHLEPAIEPVAVDDVGADPAADAVGPLQHHGVQTRPRR